MIVGTEWLIEAAGCSGDALRDEAALKAVFERVVIGLGLKTIDKAVWHKFPGEGGITGLVALTESHLACHTYPEYGVATFNLYCCRTRPEWDWDGSLRELLGAETVRVKKIEREGKTEDAARKFVSYGDIDICERGRLPHWEKEEGTYFVTFRLADSLPQNILEQLEQEREQTEKILGSLERELSHSEKRRVDMLFSERVNEYLDKGYGDCTLRDPRVAETVAETIKRFNGDRYHLYAWCVMPNHVHVVFRTMQRNKLEDILHSWKSYTAHEANKVTGNTGTFWQREYYDHLVRDKGELDRMIAYVLDNPAKAGLRNWQWVDAFGKYKIAAAL
jgi:S-adenosylmethionine/arginine decarboxylase-like enzyme/REP element-mobilizing transposase RayT